MEFDLTVLLILKGEEILEIGTPIMAQTKVILKFRVLSKGVEFNSLSIFDTYKYDLCFSYYFMV